MEDGGWPSQGKEAVSQPVSQLRGTWAFVKWIGCLEGTSRKITGNG